MGRLVKQKTRIPNFSIVINKKPSNSTTMVPPTASPSPEPEWTLEGPSNSNQVETETEEEEWMRVNPEPSQEEMVRQIRATDKGKMKYDQMQEWNPTLSGILRRRQYSPTGCGLKYYRNLSSIILLLLLQLPKQSAMSGSKNTAKSYLTTITLRLTPPDSIHKNGLNQQKQAVSYISNYMKE